MGHPYAELMRDRGIAVLWGGMAASSLGSELYRVGAVWLAVEAAGEKASLLVAAQAATILAMSLLGGAFVERWPRRGFLIAANVAAAMASFGVVAIALASGLSLAVLVTASVLLAAIGALAQPVLTSSLPRLIEGPDRLRAVNGLFDATARTAQVAGPFLAAAAMAAIPAIHLLTANGVSFLLLAGAVLIVGGRLAAPPAGPAARTTALARILRGVSAAHGCPGAWRILVTTGLRGAAQAVGFTVGVPLLLKEGGLAVVAAVFGLAAAGELITNLALVGWRPARPYRIQFAGYAVIGFSLAAIAPAATLAPEPLRLPAVMLAALAFGFGNGISGLQMLPFFGARLSGDDFAGVLRLRQAMIIAITLAATAAGPWLFGAFGAAGVILGAGLIAGVAGLAGAFSQRARRIGPDFQPLPA